MLSMVWILRRSAITSVASDQMPLRSPEEAWVLLAAAGVVADDAVGVIGCAGAAVLAALDAVGMLAAMASISALSASAPAVRGSLWFSKSVMFSSRFSRAAMTARSAWSSPRLAEAVPCSAAISASSDLSLACSSAWRSCSACGNDGVLSPLPSAVAALLRSSALARAIWKLKLTTLSAAWRLANTISSSLGSVAFCCCAPSVRYHCTVSSRIWMICGAVSGGAAALGRSLVAA